MKNWLVEKFLPMWAKETVLRDNRVLRRKIHKLEQEIQEKDSYIRGLETGSRVACQVVRIMKRGELS